MSRGGFHRQARIDGVLDEIRIEARIALGERSRRRRDQSLAEIVALADRVARLMREPA